MIKLSKTVTLLPEVLLRQGGGYHFHRKRRFYLSKQPFVTAYELL
jgi:hypothetical protein